MSAALSLAVVHKSVNDEAVALLEDMLARVKRSEIAFVLVLGMAPDGSIVDGWTSGDVRPFTVLGTLAAMSYKFAQQNTD